MEPIGALLDGEWDCFQEMFAAEEFEFTSHPFLGQDQLLLGQDEEVNLGIHSMVCPPLEVNISMLDANENLVYSSEFLNSYTVQSFSQQSTYNCPSSTHSANILASDLNCMYMDIPSVEEICAFSSSSLADMMMEDTAHLDEESNGNVTVIMNPPHQPDSLAIPGNQMTLKRKLEAQELPGCTEDKSNTSAENQKKKPRVSREVLRTKRNTQPKKSHKQIPHANVEEEIQAATSAGQSDSSCSTEEDSASQEMNGGVTSSCIASAALHCNGKTRASRGSATDPQSLYARKRRERINERLRILQNLVPNGTKVDISTMLEEAVHYVKFLQLQIKLLSSDDHWMYAPIAYNGMDMGLNLHVKIPSPLLNLDNM